MANSFMIVWVEISPGNVEKLEVDADLYQRVGDEWVFSKADGEKPSPPHHNPDELDDADLFVARFKREHVLGFELVQEDPQPGGLSGKDWETLQKLMGVKGE